MTRIAYLGLGIMGQGMVHNLLKAGYEVHVWNRTERALPDTLDGAVVADSIAAAVDGADIVICCLTGPDAQWSVLTGDDGAFANFGPDGTVIDATTTDPDISRELAVIARDNGIDYVDAPVFGSKGEAWGGALDFVCGGDREAVEDAVEILQCMAASVHHMGDSGAGAAMKLVGNLLVAAQMASLGEALSLARKSGLQGDTVMDVLDVVDFSSSLIRNVGRNSFAGNYEPSFYLRHMLKDTNLISDQGRALDIPLPLTDLTRNLLRGANNLGLGDLNASALHRMQFELSGLEDPEPEDAAEAADRTGTGDMPLRDTAGAGAAGAVAAEAADPAEGAGSADAADTDADTTAAQDRLASDADPETAAARSGAGTDDPSPTVPESEPADDTSAERRPD